MTETERKLLTPDQLDNLGLALIELAKEVWVMRDRQMVTESLLQEKGLLAELDAYQPPADLSARIAKERQRFTDTVVTALLDRGKSKP